MNLERKRVLLRWNYPQKFTFFLKKCFLNFSYAEFIREFDSGNRILIFEVNPKIFKFMWRQVSIQDPSNSKFNLLELLNTPCGVFSITMMSTLLNG